MFLNKTLRLSTVNAKAGMNAKSSVFVIGVEAITCLLYNLHNCTLI